MLFYHPVEYFSSCFAENIGCPSKLLVVFVNDAIIWRYMNKNTWNAMPPEYQTAFMEAAQIAADDANAQDKALEAEYTQKLVDAGMEIYTPNASEKAEWVKAGKAIWSEVGASIDPSVLKRLQEITG